MQLTPTTHPTTPPPPPPPRLFPSRRRERESDLSPDERLILSVISNAGRVGLWKKDISYKSRLHTNTVTKTLKRLESQRMVKTYKPYNNKTRKMYILFDLEPDNSGGWCYGEVRATSD